MEHAVSAPDPEANIILLRTINSTLFDTRNTARKTWEQAAGNVNKAQRDIIDADKPEAGLKELSQRASLEPCDKSSLPVFREVFGKEPKTDGIQAKRLISLLNSLMSKGFYKTYTTIFSSKNFNSEIVEAMKHLSAATGVSTETFKKGILHDRYFLDEQGMNGLFDSIAEIIAGTKDGTLRESKFHSEYLPLLTRDLQSRPEDDIAKLVAAIDYSLSGMVAAEQVNSIKLEDCIPRDAPFRKIIKTPATFYKMMDAGEYSMSPIYGYARKQVQEWGVADEQAADFLTSLFARYCSDSLSPPTEEKKRAFLQTIGLGENVQKVTRLAFLAIPHGHIFQLRQQDKDFLKNLTVDGLFDKVTSTV